MKRSFCLLLCLAMLVSCFAACGKAEDEHVHQFATTWTSNQAMHWNAATCEHTNEQANVALHTDANNDGTCDVCNYGSDHVHTYEEEWSFDAENHWYAVSCGHSVEVSEKAAHVDEDNNKLCDVCEYDYDHTHTYSSAWSSDATKHWHDATCGCTIEPTQVENHIDRNNDGVCEVCLGQTFASDHTHTFAGAWVYDVNSHWQVSDCHPGVTSTPAAHGDTDNDGVCNTCSFDYLHEHTYKETWSGDATNHWHAPACSHNIANKDVAAHTDANKDGACDVCLLPTYDTAKHTHTYATEFKSDANGHWHVANCEHTGATSKLEAHTGIAGDGVCDTCGWSDTTHTHAYAPNWSFSETEHWKMASCGHYEITDAKSAHVDENGDKACDVCGYDGNHIHEFSSAWSSNVSKHWHAATCGCSITAVEQEHTDADKDGVCDVCDAKTYAEDHVHEFAKVYTADLNNHWYDIVCVHTGIVNTTVEAHTDVNNDGLCDVCENKTYANDHEHTYATVYTSDIEGHWYACTCHTGIAIVKEAHTDADNDGTCDVCNNVIDNTHSHTMELVEKDGENHTYACTSHTGYKQVNAHSGMADGVCDICAYSDLEGHTHTYATELSKDMNAHWYEATCSHTALVEKLAHVDENEDGKCDTCEIETLGSIINDVTSDAAKDMIISGIYDSLGENAFYKFGDNYFYVMDGSYEFWYTTVPGEYGDELFSVVDYGSGYQQTYDDIGIMDGVLIQLDWNLAYANGVENTIAAMWEQAMFGTYTMSQNGENSYSFTYFYEASDWWGNVSEIYVVTVSFDVDEYKGQRYVSAAEFEYTAYEATEEGRYIDPNTGRYVYDVSKLNATENSYSFEVTKQRPGTRTDKFPFDLNDFYVSDYDLVYNDQVVTEETTITVNLGDYNGEALYYQNVESVFGSFTFDQLTITAVDANGNPATDDWGNVSLGVSDYGDYLHVAAGNASAGVYTVTVTSGLVTKTFKVEVKAPETTTFESAVNTDDGKQRVNEYTVFVGNSLKVMSYVNSRADASYTIVITSENAADAVLVVPESTAAVGEWNYYYGNESTVTFNKAGVYTVVLTSVANPELSATLKVTVTEPPKASDILKGSYMMDASDWNGTLRLYVTFTPSAEGADNGTAVITVNKLGTISTYDVKYSYDAENDLVLKNTDDSAFTDATITLDNNFKLQGAFGYEIDYGGGYVFPSTAQGTLTASDPYTPPTAMDMVVGEYRYNIYAENGWSIASQLQIILNADGTGTFANRYMDENYQWVNSASATFKFTAVDNGNGTYNIVITDVVGTQLNAGTYVVGTIYNSYGEPVNGIQSVSITIGDATTAYNLEIYY